MSGNNAIVVLPTDATVGLIVGVGKQATYAGLNGKTYSTLGGSTYGQLQLSSSTNAEVAVIPTNAATVRLSGVLQRPNYGDLVDIYGTYGAMAAETYGQLSAVA